MIGRCFGGWPTSSLRTQEPIIPGRQLMAKMSAAVLERRAAAYAFAGTTQADSKSQTTADTTSRSRGLIRPRFAIKFPYPPIRGRRECRAPDAPAAACAMIVVERTRVSQVTPESPGIPRAMVLRFPSCSPAIGLFCHRHLRNCFHRLDTSVEMSGPHDFTVRSKHRPSRAPLRPPHPAPTSVTFAKRPSE